MAEALYRKYRPQVFDDVIGQEHIGRTLRNAIDGNRVSHAYLFTGPRGTGKTTTARLLAKALMCQNGPTSNPCSECEDCELIAHGMHPDVYELDAASRTGVDNVREEIIGRVQYAPTRGQSKIYIVDEVHMLSTAAFNALLKTLEEPPSHVVFILCTTDPQKVPETIRSRCQRFDFRRISAENIISRLGAICVAEEVQFEGEALDLIAQRADGGMRDALTSLEQLIVYGEGTVTLAEAERLLGSLDSDEMAEIVEAIGRRDAAAGFRWTAHYMETGADLAQFVQDLAERIRNLYVFALLGSDATVAVGEVERRHIVQELPLFGPDRLAYILGVLGDLQKELKTSANQRLAFEIALTRMARPASDLTLEALAARVEALEASAAAVANLDAIGSRGGEGSPCNAEPAGGGDSCDSHESAACSLESEASSSGTANCSPPGHVPSAQAEQKTTRPELSNNAALQRAWQQVMTIVKKEKTAYGVLFLNTKARSNAGQLVIEFSAESNFAFKAVQKPEIDDVLARAIRQVFSADVPYSFVQASAEPCAAPASVSSLADAFAPAAAPAEVASGAAAPAAVVAAGVVDVPAASPVVRDKLSVPNGELPALDDEPPFDPWVPAEEEEEEHWAPVEAMQPVNAVRPAETAQSAAAQPIAAAQSAMPAPGQFESAAGTSTSGAQTASGAVGTNARSNQTPSDDADMNDLQDALSLFGAVKIEEID